MRRNRAGARLAAVAGVAAVAMTALAPAAAAAAGDTSRAEARFLSGSGGGTDFDAVAALEGVAVKRSGDKGTVKEANPLKGSLLGQSLPEQPNGVTIPLEFTDLGAVNQYAKASPRAEAIAASGAVANGGAINTTNDKDFPELATLDLAKVPGLPKEVTEQVLDLKLNIGAISAVAAMNAKNGPRPAVKCADPSEPKQCRDYGIAGANVTLKLQALKTLFDRLKPLENTLDGRETSNLQSVCEGLDSAPSRIERVCKQIDEAGKGAIEVTATPPDVQAILDSATKSTTEDGIEVDLTKGEVVIDLAEFLRSSPPHLDLNNLPPNTELVQYIVKALANKLPTALNSSLTNVAAAINAEMGKAKIGLSVADQDPQELSGRQVTENLEPLIDQLSAQVGKVTDQITSTFRPGVDQLGALQQLLAIHANVQDSPADGVFRETALKIELLAGALPSGAKAMPSAPAESAVEINLARAQVGAALGHRAPAKDVPAGTNPPTAGPDLPNTGAGTLDLPFLLLGLGLVTGGFWIVMYGRSERLDL